MLLKNTKVYNLKKRIKKGIVMKIQVLVATMHQKDKTLIEKMNIQSDAIIGNQCSENYIESFEWNGHKITYLNFAERGLSLNRNNALIRASADICLLADDDMVYDNDYCSTVERVFDEHPDADVIIFNIKEPVPTRAVVKKTVRVNYFNYLRYGSVRIAFRLNSIRSNAISFNQCFGTGTERGFGEDNLFLTDCLNNKLTIYAVPEHIASLTEERPSTWFDGYDERYLYNKGMLFRAITKRWWRLLCLQDAIRHHREYRLSWVEAYRLMIR